MRQQSPPEPTGSSMFGKVVFVIGLLAIMGAGGAFVWKQQNPPKPYEFEPLYDSPPPNAKRILWVGNSHMWWWDLPVELQRTVPDGQSPMWFELVAQPGVSLDYHLRTGPAVEVARQGWDIILLQPQSVEPVASAQQFTASVQSWETIAEESGAQLVVWAPWGRDPNNDGYGVYDAGWSGGSLEELTNRMQENSENAAQKGEVCPIGAAWLRAFRKHPKAPLWGKQMGNHASQFGAYLTNAMLYACLWNADPREITYVPELVGADSAEKLRVVAWETAVEQGILEGELPAEQAEEDEPESEDSQGSDAPEDEPDAG